MLSPGTGVAPCAYLRSAYSLADRLSLSLHVLCPGVATSLIDTGQQWDAPNAWPPLQHMVIEGLSHAGVDGASDLACDLAGRWLSSTWQAYRLTGHMHEKYDAAHPGQRGGGGEYEPQASGK